MKRRVFFATLLAATAGLIAANISPARTVRPIPLLTYPPGKTIVGQPVTVGPLTVYPLIAKRPGKPFDMLTMDQAMKRGKLVISERKKRASVRHLLATNHGSKPVFIMAGEMIVGAKQDRMISRDVIVPPHQSRVIPVYCVERGRWRYSKRGARRFKSAGKSAPNVARKLAYAKATQGRVWREVDRQLGVSGARTRSRDLKSAYAQPEVRKKVKTYKNKLQALPAKVENMIGAIVVLKGRFLALDAFGHPALFKKLWPKLIGSYALDAVGGTPRGPAVNNVKEAVLLLIKIDRAQVGISRGIGLGTVRHINDKDVDGSALVLGNRLVHMAAFPKTVDRGRRKHIPRRLNRPSSGYRSPGSMGPRRRLQSR